MECDYEFLLDDCPAGLGVTNSNVSIGFNDNSEIIFWTSINPNGHLAILKLDAGTCSVVVTAGHIIDEKCIVQPGANAHLDPSQALRNDGTVLFGAPLQSDFVSCVAQSSPDGFGLFTSAEGLRVETGDDADPDDGTRIDDKVLIDALAPWVNEAGEVVFNGLFDGGSGIFSTARGLLVESGDTIDGHVLNGTTPFSARDGSGQLSAFLQVRSNDNGLVVFPAAILPDSSIGLFTPDQVILAPGDIVGDKTVRTVQEFDLNEHGDIVIDTVFVDGSTGMVLATPREVPASPTGLTLPVGGEVVVEFIGGSASELATLSLVSPAVEVPQSGCEWQTFSNLPFRPLLDNQDTQAGCRVILDADAATPGIQGFTAGTVLDFRLCVQNAVDPSLCDEVTDFELTPHPNDRRHVFQLGWNTDGDTSSTDVLAVVRVQESLGQDHCPTCTTLDTDGDGLWNDWETKGIDTDGDFSTFEVNLRDECNALGRKARDCANPRVPDLFVELDYMDCNVDGGNCVEDLFGSCTDGQDNGGDGLTDTDDPDCHSHRPKAQALALVEEAFAVGGARGPINLHIDVDDAIPHQDLLKFESGGTEDFAARKAEFFDSTTRRFVYRYGILGHTVNQAQESGKAEIPGNDFMVALGGSHEGRSPDQDGDQLNDVHVGTVVEQAGTIMHELGHTLGLRHGGHEENNKKPNYFSVMNYVYQKGEYQEYQPSGLQPPFPFFSDGDCEDLDENSLDEPQGMCQDAEGDPRTFSLWKPQTFCWLIQEISQSTLTLLQGPATEERDWNCNAELTNTAVAHDINNDNQELEVLTDHDDWTNLVFSFHTRNASFEDGEHGAGAVITELTTANPTIRRATSADSFLRKGGLQHSNEGANQRLWVKKNIHTVVGFDLTNLPTTDLIRAQVALTVAQKAGRLGPGGPRGEHLPATDDLPRRGWVSVARATRVANGRQWLRGDVGVCGRSGH